MVAAKFDYAGWQIIDDEEIYVQNIRIPRRILPIREREVNDVIILILAETDGKRATRE
jgi:hypothetical protein